MNVCLQNIIVALACSTTCKNVCSQTCVLSNELVNTVSGLEIFHRKARHTISQEALQDGVVYGDQSNAA